MAEYIVPIYISLFRKNKIKYNLYKHEKNKRFPPPPSLLFHHSFFLRKGSSLDAVKVMISPEEPIENVLRRFKRSVNQSGHLMDLRFKEEWENAHDKRKRKNERNLVLKKMERVNIQYENRAQGVSEYNS